MKPNKNNPAPQKTSTPSGSVGSSKVLTQDKSSFQIPPRILNILLLAIISVVFWGTYAYVFDTKLDLNGDNIIYYSLGQSLHQGKGFSNIMSFNETPHSHFPPGYPFFLSLIMKFTDSISAMKFMNGLLFFLSVVLLFFIFKKVSNQVWISFAACLMIAFHGEIHRWATIMMSEMLYMFLTILLTWIILSINPENAFSPEKRKKTILKCIVFAVCFGYIYLVRTMGTSYILAVLFVLLGQTLFYLFKGLKNRKEDSSWWKNGLLTASLLLLLAIASFGTFKKSWDARNKSIGVTQSEYMGDFKGKMGGGEMETTSDWVDRIKKNFELYVTTWIPQAVISPAQEDVDITQSASSGAWLGGLILFGIILVGSLTLKDKFLVFLYLGVTFAVLMVWQEQYGGLRYFITLIPLVIFCFLHGLWKVLEFAFQRMQKKEPTKIWNYALCLVVPMLLISNYSKSVNNQHEMAKYKDWNDAVDIIGPAGAEYIAACNWLGKNVPNYAVVACRKPELFYMYSGYHKAIGILREGKPEQILNYLIKNKVEYIIVDHWYRHAFATIIPLATQYYPYMFEPILAIGGEYKDVPPTYILRFKPNAKPTKAATDQQTASQPQAGNDQQKTQ